MPMTDLPKIGMVVLKLICHPESTPLISSTIVNTYIVPIDSENVHLNVELLCWFWIIYQ
jgi:hypothetical protein